MIRLLYDWAGKGGVALGAFAIVSMGLNVGKGVWANAYGTGLSPCGPSQQAVSSAPPLPSLSQEQN